MKGPVMCRLSASASAWGDMAKDFKEVAEKSVGAAQQLMMSMHDALKGAADIMNAFVISILCGVLQNNDRNPSLFQMFPLIFAA